MPVGLPRFNYGDYYGANLQNGDGGPQFNGMSREQWDQLTPQQQLAALYGPGNASQPMLRPGQPGYDELAQATGTTSGRPIYLTTESQGRRGFLNDPRGEFQGDGFFAHAEDNQTPDFQSMDDQPWNWGALIGTPLAFMGAGMLAQGGMFGGGWDGSFGLTGGLAPEEAAGTGWGSVAGGAGAGAGAGGAGAGAGAAGAGAGAGGAAAGGAGGGLGTAGNIARGIGAVGSLVGGGAGAGGGGGGGGGNGSVRYEWSDQMRGRWEPLLDRAADISNRPYTPYGGPRVAGLSGDEQSGMGAIRNFVSDPSSYLYGRGVDQLYGTVEGDYLTGNKADPYANSGNRYSGTNPEFNNMLQAGMGDISRTFHDETAGNLARFKGPMRHSSAFEQANTDTEDAFAKRLGQFASGMYSDQYKRSADMEENRLNRGSTAYQNERGRQMGASGLSQNDQNLTLDRGRALMGIGGLQRGIDQAGMDVNYQNFLEGRDWDRNQAQWLTGMYGAAQGGQLPNVQQPGPNGFQQAANWLGLASTGVGLYRSLFPGGFGGFGGTAGPAIDWGLESGL